MIKNHTIAGRTACNGAGEIASISVLALTNDRMVVHAERYNGKRF